MAKGFVVWDSDDGTFLTKAYFDADPVELWKPSVDEAFSFPTYAEAEAALEACDEGHLLRDRLHVVDRSIRDALAD